jgi:SAM-dependent methyltransferase
MPEDAPERFGWESWSWDETVFQGAASYYREGRYPYAPDLARTFSHRLGLDGHGRLLDVGCGPGTVALALAQLFAAVVGLDPDADMNATWVRMRAEELPGALGTFRIVTFAQSFHWMDRPRVAAATHDLIEPGGAVVHIDASPPDRPATSPAPERYPPVPESAIDELRIRWLGPDRRAGQGYRNTSPDDEDDVFQAAGFAPEEIAIVPDGRVIERTVDHIVARVLSTSGTAPHLFGAALPEFESDLRALLLDASPEGRFSIRLPDTRLRIRRPA